MGPVQVWDYMDRHGTEDGHLLVFDRSPGKTWKEKILRHSETIKGRMVMVRGDVDYWTGVASCEQPVYQRIYPLPDRR